MITGKNAAQARVDVAVTSTNAQFIWQLCKRQGKWILFAMFTALVSMGVTLMIADAMATIIDDGIVERTQPIAPLAARLITLGFINAAINFVLWQTMDRVVYQLEWELRTWLHQGIHARDPRELDKLATGQMVTRSMTDLEFTLLFVLLIPFLVGTGLTLTALGIWLFSRSPILTPLVILALPANIYLIRRMSKRMWGFSWLTLNRRAQVTTIIDEVVRGVRVAKAFAREPEENAKLKEAATGAYGVMLNRTRLLAKFDVLMKALPVLLNGMLFLVGGFLIVRGQMTIGVLAVFLRFSTLFLTFAQSLDEFVNIWQFARASAGRIFELVTTLARRNGKPDESPNGEADVSDTRLVAWDDQESDPRAVNGDSPADEDLDYEAGVSLQSVTVSFDEIDAVSGLDLEAGPGDTVVVLGGPRSGKTTVASLITGSLAPTRGEAQLAGQAASSLTRDQVRRLVQVVHEEPFLFGRTVRENLLMGVEDGAQPAPSDERMHEILWAAGADKIVEEDLEEGLDTVLGDRGLTLSGGQRQRIALARALAAEPAVLVLDDALQAVNPSLELEILQRIRTHAPDLAIVYLTRRHGPEEVADRTVRLPDPPEGAVSASGQVAPEQRDEMPDVGALMEAVAALPPDRDKPLISDKDASNSDKPPNVRSMLSPLKAQVIQTSLVLLVLGIATLIPTALGRYVIDSAEEGNTSIIFQASLAVVVIGFVIAGLFYVVRIMRKKVEESVVYQLRRKLFHRLTRLGIDFYDRELPGHVAARVVYDLDKISDFVEDGPFEMARSSIQLVLTFAIILWWSPPVGVVAAVFVPLMFVISAGYVPLADRAWRRVRERLGEVVSRFQEDFAGRYVVDSFGAEPKAHVSFTERTWRLRSARRTAAIITNAYRALILFLLEVASTLVIWRAGTLVLAGVLTAGTVIALRTWLDEALVPLPRLARVLRQYMVARASIRTLHEPFNAPIRPAERPENPCPPLEGAIRFSGVDFKYPQTEPQVLENVHLEILAGETCALVGPTGAGKTSIVKLLMAVYDPDEGVVAVDGHDLRQVSLPGYRRRLGIVPQDAFCFRGTVHSNIAYGRPDASREEVEKAARSVGAYEALAAIPGGFDAVVEEEGRNLTAGQRQLVALARAWLVEPTIVILDEATSSLDVKLEKKVLKAMKGLKCTTVLVTHRLNVAEQAEHIVVVDGGQVAEQGSHKELSRNGGIYSSLWAKGGSLDDHVAPAKNSSKRNAGAKNSKRKAPAKNSKRKPVAKSSAPKRKAAAKSRSRR
jgi:ATP-binding cassette, subfamily B, bacterial